MTVDYEAIARRLWLGLPLMWREEASLFEAYSAAVGQVLTEEGFELWLVRVQKRECPVAGSGCDRPRAGRFCDRHRQLQPVIALLGM